MWPACTCSVVSAQDKRMKHFLEHVSLRLNPITTRDAQNNSSYYRNYRSFWPKLSSVELLFSYYWVLRTGVYTLQTMILWNVWIPTGHSGLQFCLLSVVVRMEESRAKENKHINTGLLFSSDQLITDHSYLTLSLPCMNRHRSNCLSTTAPTNFKNTSERSHKTTLTPVMELWGVSLMLINWT